MDIVRYRKSFDRSQFDCGRPELDDWLRTQASQQEAANNTRTFLAIEDDRVVGYYSTATYRLGLGEAATAFGVGKRKYPVPAVLLARLAVDKATQGRGVGAGLLIHALSEIARAGESVGFEVVVVHAIDQEAVTFYARFGFQRFEGNPLHLFVTTKDLLRTLADESPCTYSPCMYTCGHQRARRAAMDEQTAKTERVNLRVNPDALSTVREAASLQGQDMTSFVMGAALERARAVLAEDRLLRLTSDDVLQLEKALDREPQMIPQLRRLLERYGEDAASRSTSKRVNN